MRGAAAALLLSALLLCACQPAPSVSIEVDEPPPPPPLAGAPGGADWRTVILEEDEDRLDRLEAAWRTALDEVDRRGLGSRAAREGELLDPAAALPRAAPPPGPYHCRVVRLGAGRAGALTAFPSYFCHVGVEGPLLSLTKQTGAERPGGYLWSDGDQRLVFLGATARGEERSPPPYGDDPARNLAGLVERIGPFRYRLVIPWPVHGATLDVIEMVPSVPMPGGAAAD